MNELVYNSSHSSSINSHNDEEDEKQDAKNLENDKRSTLKKNQDQLKNQIVKEVLDDILPDVGSYDVDGMVRTRADYKTGFVTNTLKIFGLDYNLHEAVLCGQMAQVQRVINKILYGKNPNSLLLNQYDKYGRTPLSIAVKTNLAPIVKLLLDSGALPDICDEATGCTPLIYSILEGNKVISQSLIAAGALINLGDFKCVTPLMVAASNDDVFHCKLISSKTVDLDLQDSKGWTALHYCAHSNAINAMHCLLSEGASRTVKDSNKRKAKDIAKYKNHTQCLALLLDLKYTLS
jgi:hypothetical protein